jgi:type I restriction enzyme S subunit
VELMPGYRQTEVGMIPEDWESTTVGGLASSVRNAIVGGPFGSDLVSTDYVDDGIPVIRGQNMGIRWLSGSFAFVSQAKANSLEANLAHPGDLVFTQRGTLGQVSLVPDQPYDRYLVSQSQMKLTVNRKVADPLFFYYLLTSSEQQERIRQNTIQTGVPHINLGILRSIPVQRPPLREQEAIAEALSGADALVGSLEQLIAKKRHLKQGAMQELLTGKERLPGFGELRRQNSEVGEIPIDWRVVEIGLIANVKTGPFGSSLHERDYVEDGIPIITVEHLGERGVLHANLPMVSEADRKRLGAYSLEEGDIVFSRVGSVDRNARISRAEHGWLFSGRLLRVRPFDDSTDTNYLSYHFHFEPFKQRVRTVAVGQTMASLNTQILKSVLIVLPEPREQAAIAAILTDMDAEIAAVEAKLAKAQQIKQGMMHNLLTGRIRLV